VDALKMKMEFVSHECYVRVAIIPNEILFGAGPSKADAA
jgi:hypothetical protein